MDLEIQDYPWQQRALSQRWVSVYVFLVQWRTQSRCRNSLLNPMAVCEEHGKEGPLWPWRVRFSWDQVLKIEQNNMDSAWGKKWSSVSNELIVSHSPSVLWSQIGLQITREQWGALNCSVQSHRQSRCDACELSKLLRGSWEKLGRLKSLCVQ